MKLKQKFSRISALLLAMLMLLGTVACAGTEDTADTTADTTGEPGETTAEPSDDPVGDEKNVILYVSPDGDDETGKPYRTLEGVKNAVRAIDKTNLESITVYFKKVATIPTPRISPKKTAVPKTAALLTRQITTRKSSSARQR